MQAVHLRFPIIEAPSIHQRDDFPPFQDMLGEFLNLREEEMQEEPDRVFHAAVVTANDAFILSGSKRHGAEQFQFFFQQFFGIKDAGQCWHQRPDQYGEFVFDGEADLFFEVRIHRVEEYRFRATRFPSDREVVGQIGY